MRRQHSRARMQCDVADDADVRHRMVIAQTTLDSLSSIWTDHRLSRAALKLRTYQLAVCSTLTHASEAWKLTEPVMCSVNGFNSRCLHVITGQDNRVTATAPEYCNIMPIIFEYNLHYNRGLLLDLVERCRIRLEVNRSPGSTPGPRLRVYSVACNCLY